MQFILIDDDIYPLTTDQDIDEAQQALHDAGLPSAVVYVGDPDSADGNSYTNGHLLWAKP